MNITIRPMIMSDYSQVRKVDILTQQQYLGNKFNEMKNEEQETHLVSKRSEFSINVDTGYCFVAKINGEIIGFILAHETLPFHGVLFIHYIGINPAYQDKGIGLLLFKRIIEKAKENNISVIRSLINTDNPPSIKLHKKAGFKISLRKQAILELQGRPI